MVAYRTLLWGTLARQYRTLKWAPGVFRTYFYAHAHRLRLEKLLCLELSRSPNGHFKPLWKLNGYTFITATYNGHSPTEASVCLVVTVM
jgi:hypothetical protein